MNKTAFGDTTLERERIKYYLANISEYELIKAKEHLIYKFVKEWGIAKGLCVKTFHKYYNRYKMGLFDEALLLPGYRGPKYKTNRPIKFIENKVVVLRQQGINRYEISSILKPQLGNLTPSPSGVYNISKRYDLNVLKRPQKEEKRKIIKERMGQMGHIDVHYLNRYIIHDTVAKRYLVAIQDDYSRITWAEVIEDTKSLTVMFGAIKCFNALRQYYGITFEEVLSDNGSEFGNKQLKKKDQHPFERLLIEMGVKHRYTQPYRPETNGKIERFWRSIEEDLLIGTDFKDTEDLKKELVEYLYYYNNERPHQGISGKKPIEMIEKKTEQGGEAKPK